MKPDSVKDTFLSLDRSMRGPFGRVNAAVKVPCLVAGMAWPVRRRCRGRGRVAFADLGSMRKRVY